MKRGQLNLFGAPPPATPPYNTPAVLQLAADMPPHVRLGPSSWTFPGWRGIVWPDEVGWSATSWSAERAHDGLELATRHPLFRTIGIDRSFYAPIPDVDLVSYGTALQPNYPCVIKVWDAITVERPIQAGNYPARFAKSPDASALDAVNPHFLSIETFLATCVEPYERNFADHVGTLVLEFSAGQRLEPRPFFQRLDRFLSEMRSADVRLPVSVEVRDRNLLQAGLGNVLVRHRIPLCFSYHPTMPPLHEQLKWAAKFGLTRAGAVDGPWVTRLMLPPGERYVTRRAALAPFDRIQDPQPEMRADLLLLVDAAEVAAKDLLVTVNNKVEGSAPLTVLALAEQIVRHRGNSRTAGANNVHV